MSKLRIQKYSFERCNQNIPNQEWEQVDSNPTAIGILLFTIDGLKPGESITITKQ